MFGKVKATLTQSSPVDKVKRLAELRANLALLEDQRKIILKGERFTLEQMYKIDDWINAVQVMIDELDPPKPFTSAG